MEAGHNRKFDLIESYLKAIVYLLVVIAVLIGYQSYQYYKATAHNNETFNKVSAYLDNNDNNGLLLYSEKVLANDPQDPDALWGKAVALFRLKRYNDSKQAFEKVKETIPQWSEDVDNYLNIINQKIKE